MKTFNAKVEKLQGAGYAYVDIPFDCEKEFGNKYPIKVNGEINGRPFISSVKNHKNGGYFLVLTRGIRIKNNLHLNDIITISIKNDEPVKEKISIPQELQSIFRKDKSAAAYFESLPTTFKKQFIKWIDEAKLEHTRNRRIQQTVQKLLKREKLKERSRT